MKFLGGKSDVSLKSQGTLKKLAVDGTEHLYLIEIKLKYVYNVIKTIFKYKYIYLKSFKF